MADRFKCDSYETAVVDGEECFRCAHVTAAGIRPCAVKWLGCVRMHNCDYCSNKGTELCGDCGYAPEENIETESWE